MSELKLDGLRELTFDEVTEVSGANNDILVEYILERGGYSHAQLAGSVAGGGAIGGGAFGGPGAAAGAALGGLGYYVSTWTTGVWNITFGS